MKNELSWITVADFYIIEKDVCKTFYTSQEFYQLKNAIENAKKLIKDESVVTVIVYRKIEDEPIEYYCEFNKY